MKTRKTPRYILGITAGAILALAQTAGFAQTTPATTSMLLKPPIPVASAHAHSSAAPAQSTPTPLIRRGMKMHVQNWAKLPTGSSNTAVTPLDPNTIPKFVNQLTRPGNEGRRPGQLIHELRNGV